MSYSHKRSVRSASHQIRTEQEREKEVQCSDTLSRAVDQHVKRSIWFEVPLSCFSLRASLGRLNTCVDLEKQAHKSLDKVLRTGEARKRDPDDRVERF